MAAPLLNVAENATCSCTAMKPPDDSPDTVVCAGSMTSCGSGVACAVHALASHAAASHAFKGRDGFIGCLLGAAAPHPGPLPKGGEGGNGRWSALVFHGDVHLLGLDLGDEL